MIRLASLLATVASAAAACTGHTFGENGPGGGDGPDLGTYLEGGDIAVDGRNENIYVLATERDEAGLVQRKQLMVAPPGATRADVLADMAPFSDVRMLFVDAGVLVMGERGGLDELILYDTGGTREVARRSTGARYHGTRVSGGGEFVAVSDSAQPSRPIHIVRARDLSIRAVPHDGDWLEANWANRSDHLVAAVFYDAPDGTIGTVRLMSWAVKSLADAEFPEAGGFWADPLVDVAIPDTTSDPLFSFSWIAMSPDDSIAVVPVVQQDADTRALRHRLVLLTLATGQVRIVDDARGPVGFTPDGTTIVTYRDVAQPSGEPRPHLLLVDTETLAEELIDEPSPGLVQYFVTRDGHYVVVGDFFGSSELTLVDLDTGTSTRLGRALDLHEFVSRPGTGEIYLVDEGLFRLDLFEAALDEVALDFVPAHINRLPSDRLVVDDPAAGRLRLLDPDSGAVVRSIEL